MHKYKYFLMFFCCVCLFVLCFWFPISFDNNDDQTMFFINSGVLSGVQSPYIMHTNLIIGHFLTKLFSISGQVNWYTLYLQIIQIAAMLTILFVLIHNDKVNFIASCLLLLFLLLGFYALYIVKMQFTSIALLCCGTALLCMQSSLSNKSKYILGLFFIAFSILIRKDTFFIFVVFSVPFLLFNILRKEPYKHQLQIILLSAVLFFLFSYINNNNAEYKNQETYKYARAIDDVIDKPVKYTTADLARFHFTEEDMVMMRARYPASTSYSSGKDIIQLAENIKSSRPLQELKAELKKFVLDERYVILIYILTMLAVLFLAPTSFPLTCLNGLVFLLLLLYLTATIRIPHRVTFPILFYLATANLYLLLKDETRWNSRTVVLSVFFILGCYKFYCTLKLKDLQTEYHARYKACQKEINTHPGNLFIGLHDGFPIEFMNAWQTPENMFVNNNLIMTGWNVWTPDFKNILDRHQLKNITSDLKDKKNVLFLTNSELYQLAFVEVMKQRYNIKCHFEKAQEGFSYLEPKKLVIDN